MNKSPSQIEEEWKSLPSAPTTHCRSKFYLTANANLNLNRYHDVLPFEKTRVLLENTTYINASYIEICSQFKFIASQAPIPPSFDAFWEMIWEKHVVVIVMLARFIEKRKVKAHCYWPDQLGVSEIYGDLQVLLIKKKTTLNGVIVHHFTITKGDQSRTLIHIHYIEWPDFGVPASTEAIREIKSLAEKYSNRHTPENGLRNFYPILVHCSAGIGRAGTFLAFLNYCELVRRGKNHEELSIGHIVSALRQQRMCMVQTKEQFFFIYKLIADEYNFEFPFTFSSRRQEFKSSLTPSLPDIGSPLRKKVIGSTPRSTHNKNRNFLRKTHTNLSLSTI